MGPVEQHPQSKSPFAASEDEVIRMLNSLMTSLHLPISILSPTDLTPSLLFAVLESFLGQKLPIPPVPTHPDNSYSGSSILKVQKVKLFLGVLETDILQEDVGLSKIDPRRLAAGEWPEAFFIARVMCMVGLRSGLIPGTSSSKVEGKEGRSASPRANPRPLRKTWSDPSTSITKSVSHRLSPSPQPSRYPTPELDTTCVFYVPSSTNTRTTRTVTSLFDGRSLTNNSRGTSPELASPPEKQARYEPSSRVDDAPTPSSVALSFDPPFQSPPTPKRTIGHHHSSSLLLSVDSQPTVSPQRKKRRERAATSPGPSAYRHKGHEETFNTTVSTSTPSSSSHLDIESDYDFHPHSVPVRYSGYIERVDEDSEIASYEHSRSFNLSASSPRSPLGMEEEVGNLNESILRGLDGDGEGDTGVSNGSVGSSSRGYADEDPTSRTMAAIHQEYERTLKLLDERAKLLQELAELKVS
ncbi:hypothetical protein FA13DRAFT_1401410 [Coprinellus micaceus]|uniref:DUF5745 domain-containing protein n=1 Tax=Coprinellus micaceus TaxID=71717 RepID=A0A4Y7SPE3_COPMI|nr:hypothetical protein FA13DRAFT_1401410 [Coprinellus micaceus]